jgi:hypothetical protein
LLVQRFGGRAIQPNHFESNDRTPSPFDAERFGHASRLFPCAGI